MSLLHITEKLDHQLISNGDFTDQDAGINRVALPGF